MAKTLDESQNPVGVIPAAAPPYEWFEGPRFKSLAWVIAGDLEETRAVTMAQSGGTPTYVRIQRIPMYADPSVDGKFEVAIFVGEHLAVRMPAAQFTEAFLAVVPRWFWKPKDERP